MMGKRNNGTNLIKKVLFLDHNIDEIKNVADDILEENRKGIILYSSIIVFGMGDLLILSFFVDVLASSRLSYGVAVTVGFALLVIARWPARKYIGLTVICKYVLVLFLLGFGIVLGTVVEPKRESVSFAVLLFVAPLLFTDLPYRINAITVLSIVAYIFAAKATQSDEMFGFNLSAIMPYGIANLILTHFTAKMKIERFLYANEKKIMAEYDRLTGLLNRWSCEQDAQKLVMRKSTESIVGICSFDVNNLKYVNDQYGHIAGDMLLVAAARAIDKIFGKYGKCYRIGGDEFLAVIEDVYPNPEELIKMLDRETASFHCDYGFALSISCGIVEGDPANMEKLIADADRQMYQHKHEYYVTSGRDRRKNRM